MNIDNQIVQPTSYIFVIDDSGSMKDIDPEQERYSAIKTVLQDKPEDFSFMIYSFANDATIIRDMASISEGIPEIRGNNEGKTAIRTTLGKVLDDFKAKKWDGGSTPKVILLSDGAATDINLFSGINKILKRYASNHISISTVGLQYADEELMNKIAKKTGGVFVNIADASQLSEAMRSAGMEYTERDLLSIRYMASLNFLYGILRIVFLAILGVLLGFEVCLSYGSNESSNLIICSSIIKAIIGAFIMEFGTGILGFSDKFTWFVLWVLLALTIATRISHSINKSNRMLH